jgi:hypothetical protein
MRTHIARLAAVAGILSACALGSGCGGAADTTDNTVSGDTASSWQGVGYGVAYQKVGEGDAVLIAYGGYSAQLPWSEAWGRELVRAKLGAMGVGHVYGVQGPRDAGYNGDEIGNSKLRAHLTAGIAASAPFILVAAHSSGAFVAHELLRQLDAAGDDATLGKIVYADLDAGDSGFSKTIASKLRRVVFVSGRDASLASGTSENASTAKALGTTYAAYGSWFEVVVNGSGCHSGAHWCLHDLLVTHRPHRPDFYDLKDDYVDFAGREVTTEYIDSVAEYLQ